MTATTTIDNEIGPFWVQVGTEPRMRGPFTLAAAMSEFNNIPPGTRFALTDDSGLAISPAELHGILERLEDELEN